MHSTKVACSQNIKEIEQYFPNEYDKLNIYLINEVRNQDGQNWKLKE